MMLPLISILIFVLIGNSQSSPVTEQIYDTKYDNVDIDEILNSERLLKNYIKCLDNTGPCTADGKMLKETLPDAISTDCSKCSEKQKYGAEKITHYLIDHKPQDWKKLENIYDPEGTYRKNYMEETRNLGTTTEISAGIKKQNK